MKPTSMMKCAIWSRFCESSDILCNLQAFFFQEDMKEMQVGD